MLNIVDLFNSKVSLFQHDPQAHSCVCSILTWVKKVHLSRNWLLEFSNSYEQPSSVPRHCKGDDVKVSLGFPKSVLHSCCIHTHSWRAWLTSSLIIMDVRSAIFQLFAQFCRHSALLLCHHLTHQPTGGDFRCRNPALPIKTKYHYELLCRTKFPGSFPVPVIVSHE